MEKAIVISIQYQQSNLIKKQGTKSDVERYIRDGYYVNGHNNGFWILVKNSKIYVTARNSYGLKVFNMKGDICNFYGKMRSSKLLADRFDTDIKHEKVHIYMDAEGNYLIRQN